MRRHRKHTSLVDELIQTYGRSVIVMGAFLGIGAYLLMIAAKYTLADHQYYQTLADRQQIRTESSFVNRGTIYAVGGVDEDEDPAILSASAIVKDFKIDPSQEGDRGRLVSFVADVVYRHLCENRRDIDCYDNIQKYINEYDFANDFTTDETTIKDLLLPTVREQVNRKYKTRIFLKGDLSQDTIAELRNIDNQGVIIEGDIVYVNPVSFGNSSEDALLVARIVGITPEEMSEALVLRENKNVDVVEKLSLTLAESVQEAINIEREQVRNKTLDISQAIYPFLKLEDHPVRIYPEGEIASHVTGFVDGENVGRYGIEGFFDEQLAGLSSDTRRHKDALGRPIEPLGEEEAKEVRGINIYLTIDRNVQKEVMRIMKQLVSDFGANSGSAIVMDPYTGAIRAMVNYPTYDPERPGNVYTIERFRPGEYLDPVNFSLGKPMFIQDPEGIIKKTYQGEVFSFYDIEYEDELDEHINDPTKAKYVYENGIGLGSYLNQVVSSLYEPGSVFKAITVAIGLDTGEIEPDTIYEDVGSLMIDNFEINNLINERCEGWHTFRNALNFSCNVGMVRIAQRIGMPLFHQYIREFGFGERTGISLDGETTGTIEPYEKWSRAKLFTTSFGQGIQTTLLQMAAAYGVLANGGIYMQPYIVDARQYSGGQIVKTTPTPLRRVISEESSRKVTGMLTEGMRVGFAKAASVAGYDQAGKTGTSQIATRGVYERDGIGHTITSFGGYGPSSDPKFVLVVKFDRPRSTQFSASTSAVGYQQISEYLLQYYNVPKE